MTFSTRTFVDWYRQYVGFPAHRLESPVELLALFAFAAEADQAGIVSGGGRVERQNNAEMASRRQQAENRRRAHFKSDNRVNT